MVTYVTLHISTITVDTMHTNKIDFTAVLSVGYRVCCLFGCSSAIDLFIYECTLEFKEQRSFSWLLIYFLMLHCKNTCFNIQHLKRISNIF